MAENLDNRVYIDIPREITTNKEELASLKESGAKFDAQRRAWYADKDQFGEIPEDLQSFDTINSSTLKREMKVYVDVPGLKGLNFEDRQAKFAEIKDQLAQDGVHFDKYHNEFFFNKDIDAPTPENQQKYPLLDQEKVKQSHRQYIKVPFEDTQNQQAKEFIYNNKGHFDPQNQAFYYIKTKGENNPLEKYPQLRVKQVLATKRAREEEAQRVYIEIPKDLVKSPEFARFKEQNNVQFEPKYNQFYYKPLVDASNQVHHPQGLKDFKQLDKNEVHKNVRQYIDVPYDVVKDEKKKTELKNAGMQWDNFNKSWFYMKNRDQPNATLTQFKEVKLKEVITNHEQKEAKKAEYEQNRETIYFDIPEAKNNQELRNQIKSAGAYFDQSHQTWAVTKGKDQELKPELQGFKQVPESSLSTYKNVYMKVADAEIYAPNANTVREELKSLGCKFDQNSKSWFKTLKDGEELPEPLKKYPQIDPQEAKNQLNSAVKKGSGINLNKQMDSMVSQTSTYLNKQDQEQSQTQVQTQKQEIKRGGLSH